MLSGNGSFEHLDKLVDPTINVGDLVENFNRYWGIGLILRKYPTGVDDIFGKIFSCDVFWFESGKIISHREYELTKNLNKK